MSYIIDQQSILFYRRILSSYSTTLRILVDHKQDFTLSHLSSRDTIKRCM